MVPTFEGYYVGVNGAIGFPGDVDHFRVEASAGERFWLLVDTGGILDNGFPAVFVDGDPERDGVHTDVVVDVDIFGTPLHVDSSQGAGAPPPPAEGVLLPSLAMVRVSGPAAGTYRLFIPYTGEPCPVPVELSRFTVE